MDAQIDQLCLSVYLHQNCLPPVEIADRLRLKEWAIHRLLIERRPRTALLAERPEAAKMIDYPASDEFMQQVAALNLPGLWSPLDLPVLAIHGSAEFVTSKDDNRAIVDAVNRTHPGRGEFASVGQMDHCTAAGINRPLLPCDQL